MEYLAVYLQRLIGPDLRRAGEDLGTLVGYANRQKWPQQYIALPETVLSDDGVRTESRV